MWVMSCTGNVREGFGGFEKKVSELSSCWPNGRVEFLRRKKKVDFRLLAEAMQRVLHVVVMGGGQMEKSS